VKEAKLSAHGKYPSYAQRMALVQAKGEPTQSYLKQYNYKDYAWTVDQADYTDYKSWDQETQNPSGYQKALGAMQVSRSSSDINFPYRKNAWSHEQSEHMNEKEWDEETRKPTGY